MNQFVADPENNAHHQSEIRCPSCRALYLVPTSTLRDRSRLRCSSCTHIFPSPFYSSKKLQEDKNQISEGVTATSSTIPAPFISPEKEQEYLNAIKFDSEENFSSSPKIPDEQRHRLFSPVKPQSPSPPQPFVPPPKKSDLDTAEIPSGQDDLRKNSVPGLAIPTQPVSPQPVSPQQIYPAPPKPQQYPQAKQTTVESQVGKEKQAEDWQLEKLAQWTTSQADSLLKTSSSRPDAFTPAKDSFADKEPEVSTSLLRSPSRRTIKIGLTLILLTIAIAGVTGGWLFWSLQQQQISKQQVSGGAEYFFEIEQWPRAELVINEQQEQVLVVNGNITHSKRIPKNLNLIRVAAVVQTGSPLQPQRHVAYGWGGATLSLDQLKKLSASKSIAWIYTDKARQKALAPLPAKQNIPFQLVFENPNQPVTFLDAEVIEYTLDNQRIRLKNQHITPKEHLIQSVRQLHYRIANPLFEIMRRLQGQ